jgi:methyl-accepting chemotaxis protein
MSLKREVYMTAEQHNPLAVVNDIQKSIANAEGNIEENNSLFLSIADSLYKLNEKVARLNYLIQRNETDPNGEGESQNLEKVTQEIAGGMNEMASGADQINVAVNHVNELSGKNREGIDTLMMEVSKFKVE